MFWLVSATRCSTTVCGARRMTFLVCHRSVIMSSAVLQECEVSREPLPVCLWQENPNRLVSLLDMLPFLAYDFCRASSRLLIIWLLHQADFHLPDGQVPVIARLPVFLPQRKRYPL